MPTGWASGTAVPRAWANFTFERSSSVPERCAPPSPQRVAVPGTGASFGVSKSNQKTPVIEHHKTHDIPALDAINLVLENGLTEAVGTYSKTTPELSAWMEENVPESLAVFALPEPEPVGKRLRPSGACENPNKQHGRRAKACPVSSNEESLMRLASAILTGQSEERETGKAYLDPKISLVRKYTNTRTKTP